jgi:hypothetical protein
MVKSQPSLQVACFALDIASAEDDNLPLPLALRNSGCLVHANG